jgi:hypothetical protein
MSSRVLYQLIVVRARLTITSGGLKLKSFKSLKPTLDPALRKITHATIYK